MTGGEKERGQKAEETRDKGKVRDGREDSRKTNKKGWGGSAADDSLFSEGLLWERDGEREGRGKGGERRGGSSRCYRQQVVGPPRGHLSR